jgi:hypothetical protein
MLKFINYFLQIFFIRVYASYDSNDKPDRKDWKLKGYGILYFVLPFTGWKNPYIPIGGGGIFRFKLLYKCS